MNNISAQEIADIVGCSASQVARVLKGERNPDTDLGRRIMHVYEVLLEDAQKARAAKLRKVKELHTELQQQGATPLPSA